MSSLQNSCAICLGTYAPDQSELVCTTFCKHIFHRDCIVEWIKSQKEWTRSFSLTFSGFSSCPMCREYITNKTLTPFDPENPQIADLSLDEKTNKAVQLMNETKNDSNEDRAIYCLIAVQLLWSQCKELSKSREKVGKQLEEVASMLDRKEQSNHPLETKDQEISQEVAVKSSGLKEEHFSQPIEEAANQERDIFLGSENGVFVPFPKSSCAQGEKESPPSRATPVMVNSLLGNTDSTPNPDEGFSIQSLIATALCTNYVACFLFACFLIYCIPK